jgi:uncharacterized membrane protein YuzA (DUF378 family)
MCLYKIAIIIAGLGAINWGLTSSGTNVVAEVFGDWQKKRIWRGMFSQDSKFYKQTSFERASYRLIALSGVIAVVYALRRPF